MERESIRRDLAVFLEAETGEPSPVLADALNLREGLGLDSVDVVGLVMQVERTYRVRLSSEELEGLLTVGALLDLLEARLAARSATGTGTVAAGY